MTAPRPGFRLQRVEILNWGTFDGRVWVLGADGANCLLTGDIGAGKSTIVDAITTLLLPAHRISYNRAAGAETRERTLRSYVQGHYKSESNEATGAVKPVGLRVDGSSYSVLVGVFADKATGSTASIAQVFWTGMDTAAQPERFFVTANRELAIAVDFADFGEEILSLKRRLRRDGAGVHDQFPAYGRDFRRLLGIESEQAMELFHQTVSMKSVGNLTDFVRQHMLEPLNMSERIDNVVAHFADLTNAHEAVRRARAQLEELTPLLVECDRYDDLGLHSAALAAEYEAIPYFVADRRAAQLDGQLGQLQPRLDRLRAESAALPGTLDALRTEERRLELHRAGLGGGRLGEIEHELGRLASERDERRQRAQAFDGRVADLDLDQVGNESQFVQRRRQFDVLLDTLAEAKDQLQNDLATRGGDRAAIDSDAQAVNAELRSLRERRTSIPAQSVELRRRLCVETGLGEDVLPFAGELIQIAPDSLEWEGAAERVLRGLALSLLVPQEHYAAVASWVDRNHLRARLVYHRVPATLGPRPATQPAADCDLLVHRLDIKDSPFRPWLSRELAHRADYECARTVDEFRGATKAVTRSGQVKSGSRHEKDDRRRVDDRTAYVLGWSNEQKIDALLSRASELHQRRNTADEVIAALKHELSDNQKRSTLLSLVADVREWREIDWASVVNRIATLQGEKRQLEAGSAEVEQVNRRLEAIRDGIGKAEAAAHELAGTIGGLERDEQRLASELADCTATLDSSEFAGAQPHFGALATRAGLADVEQWRLAQLVGVDQHKVTEDRNRAAQRIVGLMGRFRQAYPQETSELDAAVAAISGYRELHARLVNDDLPRFEAEFKSYLNTNSIRDIAMLQAALNQQRELIKQRIDTINASLVDIEYDRGSVIRLELQDTPNVDVREFRADLRACTEGSLGGDSDQYSEEKFLQVSKIVERFRGREGQAEADRAWTRRVTDVRTWFVFSASERSVADGAEREHYADSDGKSGGQKEKLAYAILASSLAYQFKVDAGPGTFRFVVIDEAFGRGPDSSARFGLELFTRLGLQLLVVTPLQKIHVIEPYVASVGYVDNNDARNYSRLQMLTIEEYRERRARQLAAALVVMR